MKLLVGLYVCTLSVLFAGLSDAAWANDPVQPQSKQKVRTDSQGRRITTVDFEDALIDGQAKAPDGFFLRSRSSSKSRNILDLRRDFRRRMRASGHEGLRAVPMK
jgi:hypothetical protein